MKFTEISLALAIVGCAQAVQATQDCGGNRAWNHQLEKCLALECANDACGPPGSYTGCRFEGSLICECASGFSAGNGVACSPILSALQYSAPHPEAGEEDVRGENPFRDETEENPNPDVSEENPNPDVSEENSNPDVSEENPNPDVSEENPNPDVSEENPNPDVSEENPNPDVSEENPNPDVSEENPNPDVSEGDMTDSTTEDAEPEEGVSLPDQAMVKMSASKGPSTIVIKLGSCYTATFDRVARELTVSGRNVTQKGEAPSNPVPTGGFIAVMYRDVNKLAVMIDYEEENGDWGNVTVVVDYTPCTAAKVQLLGKPNNEGFDNVSGQITTNVKSLI